MPSTKAYGEASSPYAFNHSFNHSVPRVQTTATFYNLKACHPRCVYSV